MWNSATGSSIRRKILPMPASFHLGVSMKTTLATAAAILIATTAASSAADMAAKAPYAAPAPIWSWTGFYIGGHVGAGWGTTETTLDSIAAPGVPLTPVGLALTQNSRSGFLGGGQIGYNFQSGWAVFGVQADIAGLDVKGTTPCLVTLSCTAKSDWRPSNPLSSSSRGPSKPNAPDGSTRDFTSDDTRISPPTATAPTRAAYATSRP